MLRYHTPARVHTVHNLAPREAGVRVGAWVRMLAFRYRLDGVVPWRSQTRCGRASSSYTATLTRR